MQPLLFLLLLGAAQNRPVAQKRPAPPPPPVYTLPSAPKLPKRLDFSEELAGWRTYLTVRDAARKGSFQCELSFLTESRGRVTPSQNATETLYIEPGDKLSLTYEYGTTGRRTLRRALCDGETLLAVSFDERPQQATREFSRLYLAETGTLLRGLQLSRLNPIGTSLGAQLALEPERAMLSRFWKESDGSLLEVDSLTPRTNRPQRIRRYRLTATAALASAEEWEVREGRTSYRKEVYKPAPKSAAPFDQNLPSSYTEKPLKLPERPTETPVTPLSPETQAVLARWRRAHERFFSLHAAARVTTQQLKRTEISRDLGRGGGYNGTYDLWLQRPGSALVTIQSPDGFPMPQTIRADSVQFLVEDSARQKRQSPLREGVRLEQGLRQVALRNALEPLQWLLEGPPSPSGYDSVRLVGSPLLPDGTPTDLIELVRTVKSRSGQGDRPTTTTVTERVWLGKSGLPLGFETTRKTDVEGLFERDQPATTVMSVQLRNVGADRQPPF